MTSKTQKLIRFIFATQALFFCLPGLASERMAHPIGAYVGFQSDSVNSINLGWNVADQWRIHAGDYATFSGGFKSFNVYEAGLIYLTSSSGLSPFIGAELEGVGLSTSTHGKPSGISNSVAAEAGLDWQSQVGFNLGLRAVLPLSDFTNLRLSAYVGWYF
jgi:hypothetical protein